MSDALDHVVDNVWDTLNEATNHATKPYTYDDVAAAVREALVGAAAGFAAASSEPEAQTGAGAQVSPVQTTDRAGNSVPADEMRAAAMAAVMSDSEITAMARRGAGLFYALPSIVAVALRAALAGRTPLELPQPTGKWSDGVPYWDAENRVVAAQVDESGRPYTRLNGQIWLVTEAEAVGLALVAAAREARRLASGSSESGDPQAGDGS